MPTVRSIAWSGIACSFLHLLAPADARAQALPNRIVTFGDSLSDIGNTSQLITKVFRRQFPPPPYFEGRFSNGPVWGEYLTGFSSNFYTPVPSNAGSVNYAFGGARTDVLGPLNGLITVTRDDDPDQFAVLYPGVTYPQINLFPGIPVQIQSYLNRQGTFGTNDLVTVWGGANNFIDLFRTTTPPSGFPPVTNDPNQSGYVIVTEASVSTTGVAAATDVASSVRTIADADARRVIVLNLPDLGATPRFNRGTLTLEGLPEGPLATLGTLSFNTTLSQVLAQAATTHRSANIISVDLFSVFRAIIANPASFGFSNVTDACTETPSCAAADRAVQDRFLFWDEIHPTTSGHRLIAQTVQQYLLAPIYASQLGALSNLAIEDRRSGLLRSLERLEAGGRGPVSGTEALASIFGGSIHSKGGVNIPSYDWTYIGGAFGLAGEIADGWKVGVFGSAANGNARIGSFTAEPSAFNTDVVAQFTAGPWFAKAGLGAGVIQFDDLTRRTVGPLQNHAQTHAVTGSAALEAGLIHGFGSVNLSPRARLAWYGASVEGFTESGIVAPLSVKDRDLQALSGAVELRAGIDVFRDGGRSVTAFASVGYEGFLASSFDPIAARLFNNTAQPFSPRSILPDPGVMIGAGVAGDVSDRLLVSIDYRGSFQPNGQHHRGTGTLTYKF